MEVASSQFGNSSLETILSKKVSLTGVIVNEPTQQEKTKQFYVQIGEDRLLVSVDRLVAVSYGDEVKVSGVVKKPESFTTELGRTFDYPGYLKARSIEYQMAFAEVLAIDTQKGNLIMSALLAVKAKFVESLQSTIPEPAVSLGEGLLLGIKSALGTEVEKDFRRTGIIHIVVLSGYNVMLVVAFIMFCLSYLLPLRWRIFSGIVAIVAFALLVGLSATVVRASIMASLLLLSQLLGRRYQVLRALCLAGVVMLISNPYLLLYDVGFQLSFMATLGLVLILPQFESMVLERKNTPSWQAFMMATIAAQIAVLPLLLYHIGEVSLVALLVNMLVLPVVPIAMLLTFLTGIIGFVSLSLASLVGYVATLSLQYILVIAQQFATVPFAVFDIATFPVWGVFLFYAVLFAFWYFIKIRQGNDMGEWGDWVIESEEEVVHGEKKEPERSGCEKEDVPIFFR